MAKLKVGDKVKLTAEYPTNGKGSVNVGNIGEIVRVYPNTGELRINFPSQWDWFGFPNEVELVEDEPMEQPTDAVAERLDAIERRLASIEKLLLAKEKPEVSFNHEPRQKRSNPNIERIRAIHYANGITNELEHEVDGAYSDRYVEYHTNAQKGTVTALIKVRDRFYGRDLVVSRGIAKLAPGDVFNEYIGRAIALHRAHGLNIPKELRNAPKPIAPVIGMRVQTSTSYGVMTISDTTSIDNGTIRTGLYESLAPTGRGMAIVDDTGALY